MVYRVHYVGRDKMWRVTMIRFDGVEAVLSLWRTKALAIWEATEEARARWRQANDLTQVVVHNKDGRISREMTYGKDPARRKG